MSNYNSTLQSNNADLQALLQTLQSKAAGGVQETPVISVNSSGLITATAGTKTSTHQLAFQAAKTITPTATSQIAVPSGYYTGGDVTVAGDSNLVADNIKSGVNIFGVNGTYEGSGGSGDTSMEDGLVARTASSYINDRVTEVGVNAFYYYGSLTTVSLPNATTIGFQAFYNCSGLTTVSFPNAVTIGSNAFISCTNLTTVSFPNAVTIGSTAFLYCSKLTTVSFPNAVTIGYQAFCRCSNLTTANFPAATTIGSSAFQYCSLLTTASFPVATDISVNAFNCCYNLTTANFPAVISVRYSAFYSCSKLTDISFPAATIIYNSAFYDCHNLTTVSLPAATIICSSAFQRCYNLKSLYLTGSSICTLSNSGAFTSTPIGGYSTSAGTYGSIYVPASLLASYQAATNWTYFSSRFVGI